VKRGIESTELIRGEGSKVSEYGTYFMEKTLRVQKKSPFEGGQFFNYYSSSQTLLHRSFISLLLEVFKESKNSFFKILLSFRI
jgi:hypothetical protein